MRTLQGYLCEEETMPSYAELARLFSMASKAAAYKFVSRMESAGFLERTASGRVRPGRRFFERSPEAVVRAGAAENEQEAPEPVDLRPWLHPGIDTFIVRVRGDSMIDAGIKEGDLLLVRRCDARPGDLVIAEIDGEVTLKWLAATGRETRLDAANCAYASRRPRNALDIRGVGVGLLRLKLRQ
jgi:repressor LexA